MPVSQDSLTQLRVILVRSLWDVQLAFIPNPIALGKATGLPCRQFGPIVRHLDAATVNSTS